ncbi:MAG: response regulator transcription factor [Desulfovibrionaceae bacterium]
MRRKVLVVDDEEHIRMLVGQLLEELTDDFGVDVLMARDGEEGWRIIQQEKPDVVLLDIMMPRMNGYQVCERMAEDGPAWKDTKVVLLTAKGQETDRRQGLEAGACVYMTKPFDPDELLELTKRLMGLNGDKD